MEIDKTNKILWDVDVSNKPLYEIMYYLNLKKINKMNEELCKKGSDVRAGYNTLSQFIHILNILPESFKDELTQAKIILRKKKINRIINNG